MAAVVAEGSSGDAFFDYRRMSIVFHFIERGDTSEVDVRRHPMGTMPMIIVNPFCRPRPQSPTRSRPDVHKCILISVVSAYA